MISLQELERQSKCLVKEFLSVVPLKSGSLLVIGCSTSEVLGHLIGTYSSIEAGEAIVRGILQITQKSGIFLAAQCCEHLNRAIVLEEEAAHLYQLEPVNVVPAPKAGGSFATAVYAQLKHSVAVENIQAHAGIDIGNTLIGMHLKPVAVPVRLSISKLGTAPVVCARTRPKFIGGNRASYREEFI